jgi:peptidylprolyl isomerase|tara:strand:- start:441 stop:878 length:438 start_codon:yes stop_codon:yes gene_type:complete
MTKTVQDGSKVTLHYKGTYEDGTQFDSSYDRGEPMEVEVGAGQLIQGFNDALVGMSESETKTFTLGPADAYGDVNPDASAELPRTIFPEDFEFEEGQEIPLTTPGGQNVLATITEVKEESIMADLNHPMAGKTLTFEVEVVSLGE